MLKRWLKKKWVRFLLIFHGVLLLTVLAFGIYLHFSTTSKYEAGMAAAPYDAIIVPGVPFKDGNWSTIMKARVYWSKYLYDNGVTNNIIYSGSAVYSPYVESKIMKTYGEALGLPSAHLFTESQAEHSTENLYYSMKIAKAQGFEKVALATDPFQLFFLTRFAAGRGYDIAYLPIQFDLLETQDMTDPNIDPSSAFVDDFISLPDRQGFFERFRGTLGKHIEE